jgi:fatty acid desaturase
MPPQTVDASSSASATAPVVQTTKPKCELAPGDEWIAELDMAEFTKDMKQLGKELKNGQGDADWTHMKKILMWNQVCSWTGLLTVWAYPNPITIGALSIATFSRFTMVAHHTCHGGYDKIDKSGRFNRFKFGLGSLSRRMLDWFDWMLPEAWNQEHNQLHHYHLGEESDPDLVQRNTAFIHSLPVPTFVKYLISFFAIATWKYFYYAPNTFNQLAIARRRKAGETISQEEASKPVTLLGTLGAPEWFSNTEFYGQVLMPYFLSRFVLLPVLAHLIVGGNAGLYAVINVCLAEFVTNLHSALTIVTNHAGDDLYVFQKHCRPLSGDFYLRQVISSVNFRTGGDVNDFMHGWLNYQIEHHLFPDLSMLSYQKAQPRVKAICDKHGVPYIQHSVWYRAHKTLQAMVGTNKSRTYPIEYEPTDYDEVADVVAVDKKTE